MEKGGDKPSIWAVWRENQHARDTVRPLSRDVACIRPYFGTAVTVAIYRPLIADVPNPPVIESLLRWRLFLCIIIWEINICMEVFTKNIVMITFL